MIAGLITVLLFGLLTIGMPVAFTLAFTGALGLYLVGGWQAVSGVLATAPLSSVESYELISVPLFILMAEFVIMSGVADRLFAAAATWVGRVPGGLAMATALAGAGFGAISGSSTASAATLSSTTLPAMLKQGYDPKLSGGVVAISGTLAMLKATAESAAETRETLLFAYLLDNASAYPELNTYAGSAPRIEAGNSRNVGGVSFRRGRSQTTYRG